MMDEPAGPGTINPLLSATGNPRVGWEPAAQLVERRDVVASDSARRSTRSVHQRAPQVWRVGINLATGAEADLLRDLLAATEHGALATRWRSPDDPEPSGDTPVADAPYYRLLNGGQAADVSRAPGGHVGTFTIELERVA